MTTRVVQIEPGPDADLDGVGAQAHEVARALLGRDVARDDRRGRELLPEDLERVEDALAVAVRGVEHEEVDLGPDELRARSRRSFEYADRGADPQPAEPVFGGVADT